MFRYLRAGIVPRHDRRNGTDRPHPGSRVSHAAPSHRPGFGARASGSTTSTRWWPGLKEAAKRVADDRGLGRLSGPRRQAGTRHLDERSLGECGRSPPGAAADEAAGFATLLCAPNFVLCRPSMKSVQSGVLLETRAAGQRGILHPDAFLYPLDVLDDWNLMYGRRGFTQYQCVLPHADDNGPARRFLEGFVCGGGMAFLCVIKDCGAEGKGDAFVSSAGHVDRHGIPDPSHKNARLGRPSQRSGDYRRRTHLSDQGRVYPARALSRHGAAAGSL